MAELAFGSLGKVEVVGPRFLIFFQVVNFVKNLLKRGLFAKLFLLINSFFMQNFCVKIIS